MTTPLNLQPDQHRPTYYWAVAATYGILTTKRVEYERVLAKMQKVPGLAFTHGSTRFHKARTEAIDKWFTEQEATTKGVS